MIEVEIRAKVNDLEPIKKALQELNAELVLQEHQIDSIFGREKDLDGEHKIIEGHFSARVRQKGDKKLVEFKEINRTGVGMEFSSPVSSIETGFNFLKKLDYEEAFTVEKKRELYKYKSFEICLDDVSKLGLFAEIEYSSKDGSDTAEALEKCKELLNKIAPNAVLEPKKYGDLMQELINNQ